jgi:hypothetical protein
MTYLTHKPTSKLRKRPQPPLSHTGATADRFCYFHIRISVSGLRFWMVGSGGSGHIQDGEKVIASS